MLFASFFIAEGLSAQLYGDYVNGFPASLYLERDTKGNLCFNNSKSEKYKLEILNFPNPKNEGYRFKVRLRDGNNISPKDKLFSKSSCCPDYGIIWNFKDSLNYEGAIFHRYIRNEYDDLARQDFLKCNIIRVNSGNISVIKKFSLDSNVAFESYRYNTLCLDINNGILSVLASDKVLKPIYTTKNFELGDTISLAIYAGPDCKLTIKRIELSMHTDMQKLGLTEYTKEQIDEIIKNNPYDYNVGYWDYADRSTDDNKFILGGKYQLAIIPDENQGYKVLYVSGATKYPEYWIPYTIKGVMKLTPIINQYDLDWYSSKKELFNEECFALFEGGLLTIQFPLQNSTVRFYRH